MWANVGAIAGGLALKDAAEKTQVLLLEPVLDVHVLVADEYVGAVMSDLSTRRGRVTGTEPGNFSLQHQIAFRPTLRTAENASMYWFHVPLKLLKNSM